MHDRVPAITGASGLNGRNPSFFLSPNKDENVIKNGGKCQGGSRSSPSACLHVSRSLDVCAFFLPQPLIKTALRVFCAVLSGYGGETDKRLGVRLFLPFSSFFLCPSEAAMLLAMDDVSEAE